MTGKYKDYKNGLFVSVSVVTSLVVMFVGACITPKNDVAGSVFITVILFLAILWVEILLLARCSFTADNNKLIFRVGLLKYEYSYSKIKSAEVQTGFTHSRYGTSAHVELIITFTDGETATFCDSKVPDDALSTPEKHKEFHDNHQFTKLSNYINERAGKPDINA